MSTPSDPDSTFDLTAPRSAVGRIGPYYLLQKIGEGGMGEVWLAEQREPIRRVVAVKVIKGGMDTRQVVARFETERQLLAVMDHPAIAKVLDAGTAESGRPYFVMEYVKGEPITAYCDRQRLSTEDRLALFTRVCEGVQHAHQKGVIHRDLKPSNVLVTIQDGHPVPKIIDFGIAKATAYELTEQTAFTALGVLIGTPEYMSPEQAEMTGLDVDTRTDVYSLGVMLYELLAGVLPFDPKTLRQAGLDAIRRQIREVDPPSPSTRVSTLGEGSAEAARNRRTEPTRLVGQLRGDLDWITMKCLDKDRTRRYGSASDLAEDLRRHLADEPVVAGPPSAGYRAGKFVRRHRFGVAVAGTAALLLLAVAVAMTLQAQRIARERDRANREAARANQEAVVSAEVARFLTGLFAVSDPGQSRGRPVTAREILDKGAARVDTELAHDPVLRASLLFTLGDVYRNLGALDTAEQLISRSQALRKRALGAEAPDTLRAASLLGVVYDLRGKRPEAERILTDTLAVERRVLGPDHPNTLKTLANLANVYDNEGRFKDAAPIMADVYERRRHVLGPNHEDTWAAEYNLAVARYRAEQFDDAERLLRDVDASVTRVMGGDHPTALMARDLLAAMNRDRGRLDEALTLYQGLFETRRRVLGPDHLDTLGTEVGLANTLRGLGQAQRAEAMLREVLATQVRVLGDDHPDTLVTRTGLATTLVTLGRLDDADRAWRDTLARTQRVLGADHPSNAWCYVGLAEVEALQHRRGAALAHLGQAVRIYPPWADNLAGEPALQSLTDDPEFLRLTRQAAKRPETRR